MKRTYILMLMTVVCVWAQGAHAQDTSCGIVWEPPIRLSDTTYDCNIPKIAITHDSIVHITWVENIYRSIHRLPYTRSTNYGRSFETVRDLITDTIANPRQFTNNMLASDGQEVSIFSAEAWYRHPSRIALSKTSNRGETWTIDRIATDSSEWMPTVLVSADTFVLVYEPYSEFGSIYNPVLIYSTDRGTSWFSTPDSLDTWTRIAHTPGILHVARKIGANNAGENLYMRSFDLGMTYVDRETTSTIDGKFALEHALAASDNDTTVMMAWRDGIACMGIVGCTIIDRESKNNGLDWLSQEILTDEPRGVEPELALNRNIAAVVWTEELPMDHYQVVARVRKGGGPWCPRQVIGEGGKPNVAVSNNIIHVVWIEQIITGGSYEYYNLMYRRGVVLQTNVKELQEPRPKEFSLSQNYPNPFNPTTRIKYRITRTEYVSMKVFDVFGREVETLMNERKDPGQYEVVWKPQQLASGIYFYKITAGTYSAIGKAVLMK